MRSKVEGLVIQKFAYQEKNLMAKLLLRSGRRISVIFYGGRKTSVDIGHMLSLEISRGKTLNTLYKASEWKIIWMPELIRTNFSAFSLMCLYLEIIGKLALEESLYEEESIEQKGLFGVLANGIFYLEESLKNKTYRSEEQLILFLGKLVLEQGIYPRTQRCVFCDRPLDESKVLNLLFEKGGFSCENCNAGADCTELWLVLKKIRNESYQGFSFKSYEIQQLKSITHLLFDYFCYQYQFSHQTFKTLPMVF